MREFNVLRDSYGAEYGKHPGAQVLIVSQSGTNNWHGSAYEFLRNNDLDSRNFFDIHGAPLFQRNQFGGSLGGPIQKDKTFVFVNYEGFRQNLHQTSVTFVPDEAARTNGAISTYGSACPAAQQAACAATVEQLLNLWPLANGTPIIVNGVDSGISTGFYSPLQKIREDFGAARVDHIFSERDSFSANYTIDDGHDNTATVFDPFSTDIANLRSQVLSLEETHLFSPTLLNTARFGYSRAAYYFLGEPTPGTPAEDVTSFVGDLPVGAVVVGGSTASNPATQLGLAGSNNGTNLDVFRNLFTFEDQVKLTHGRHQFTFGAWLQPFQSNETLALSQFGQAGFGSVKALLTGVVGTFTYDPTPTQYELAIAFRCVVCGGYDPVESQADVDFGIPRGIFDRMERGARACRELFFHRRRDQFNAAYRGFRLQHEQFRIPSGATRRAGVESIRRKNGDTRRIRNLQRSAGRAGIPHGSERAVQSCASDQQPACRGPARAGRVSGSDRLPTCAGRCGQAGSGRGAAES